MFEKIFHTVIEISLGTSVVIFLFLVTKPLLDKRYSAKWRYCVWLILALRLIIPFRFSFSQTPVILPVPEREIVYGTGNITGVCEKEKRKGMIRRSAKMSQTQYLHLAE